METEKILLIDDEKDLRELVRQNLKVHGFPNVLAVKDAESAMEVIDNFKPDLILLDIMLPGLSGFEFLEYLREQSNIPVIMLTAKGEGEDRVMGFKLGADDYIVKPFLVEELVLRIKAVLKRSYPQQHNLINFPNCKVDLDRAEVLSSKGVKFSLTAKECAILRKLFENAGRIVSINSLCQSAVGDIFVGYENTLMSHIRHIREKIEVDPSKPVNLITVRGLGYRLDLKN